MSLRSWWRRHIAAPTGPDLSVLDVLDRGADDWSDAPAPFALTAAGLDVTAPTPSLPAATTADDEQLLATVVDLYRADFDTAAHTAPVLPGGLYPMPGAERLAFDPASGALVRVPDGARTLDDPVLDPDGFDPLNPDREA